MNTERAAIIIGAALLFIVVVNLGLVVGLLRSKPADGVRRWLGAARRLGHPWAEEDEALRELRRRVKAFESDDDDGSTDHEG